ncbi:MAG: thioredoxin family protein [Pseudomonadota bacterium]
MKHIKVLGSGCASCKAVYRMVEAAAKAKGVEVRLEKVEDIAEIMRHGVMSTPGVVVDGKVVHAGGMPDRAKVESCL